MQDERELTITRTWLDLAHGQLRCVGLADVEIGHEDAETGLFDHLPSEAEGSTSECELRRDLNVSPADATSCQG